jgi:antitoxin component of MazEF toxin-antitoxin module
MQKTLARHGNSLALVIDKSILELVQMDPAQPVEISTDDGRRLIISPVPDEKRRNKFKSALEAVNKRHARTLKKLAE